MRAVTALPAQRREPAAARIVLTVGTDHHPFDRLIEWTNDWLRQHPAQIPRFFVQSGAASVEPVCPSSHFLDIERLNALLDDADVMVCHGGPGSIADAWARGQLPIVVPRLRRFGEVVDDHQVDFCRKLAELGRVRLAQDPAALAALLDEAARDHTGFRAVGLDADIDAAIQRLGGLIDDLISRPRYRLPLTHPRRRVRRRPVTGTGAPAAAGTMSPGLVPDASTSLGARDTSARTGLAGLANEEQG